MNVTPELIALVQRDRERHIADDQFARIAICARACCNPSRLDRLARILRLPAPAC